MNSAFKRDDLFEVPEVKTDDKSDFSSNSDSDSNSISNSSSYVRKSSKKNKKNKKIEESKEKIITSSEDSDEDNMKLGYLSDENESNAKNIRRNT